MILIFFLQELIDTLRNKYRGAKKQSLWQLMPSHVFKAAVTFYMFPPFSIIERVLANHPKKRQSRNT